MKIQPPGGVAVGTCAVGTCGSMWHTTNDECPTAEHTYTLNERTMHISPPSFAPVLRDEGAHLHKRSIERLGTTFSPVNQNSRARNKHLRTAAWCSQPCFCAALQSKRAWPITGGAHMGWLRTCRFSTPHHPPVASVGALTVILKSQNGSK